MKILKFPSRQMPYLSKKTDAPLIWSEGTKVIQLDGKP